MKGKINIQKIILLCVLFILCFSPIQTTVSDDTEYNLLDSSIFSNEKPINGSTDNYPKNITTSINIESDVFGIFNEKKFENFTGNGNIGLSISDEDDLYAQTFTIGNMSINKTFIFTKAGLKLYRTGTITGNIVIELRPVNDSNGKPKNMNISYGKISGSTLTTSTSGLWYNVSMSPVILQKGENYSLVMGRDSSENTMYCRANISGGTYTGGRYLNSYDGGKTWGTWGNSDLLFEIYGTTDWSKSVNLSFRSNSSGSWNVYNNTPCLENGTYSVLGSNFTGFQIYYWNVSAYNSSGNLINTSPIYYFDTNPTQPPSIIINFAGNLSDKGGPYWRPPSESIALSGSFLNGYYTNNSKQIENWIYINCTVNDKYGVSNVSLHFYNRTFDTWYNSTKLVNTQGDFWEINTLDNISVSMSHIYSFDIWANNSFDLNSTIQWNKTCMNNTLYRRFVKLNNTYENITYVPFYLYKINESYNDPIDDNKKDRLYHDQGTDGTAYDIGYLHKELPNESINNVFCSSYTAFWFDNTTCVKPFTIDNIYYHIWWSMNASNECIIGWNKTREELTNDFTNFYSTNKSNNNSQIWYNNTETNCGGYTFSYNYYLDTNVLNVSNRDFTDNNVYELHIKLYELLGYPSVINNRSIISFVLFNIPDNATLKGLDNDSDGLTDYEELFVTFTSPFLKDTDNDTISDYWENQSGSNPNNYSEAYNITNITINFAGNSSDFGGPYWEPPGESTQLPAYFSGYYTNDSRQQEDWMNIIVTVNNSEGIDEVWLHWLNETTWDNNTWQFINVAGDIWNFNTSGNITVAEGYNYSFDVWANDTSNNVKILCWNKTGINGSYVRRYVQLNCTSSNISYTPFYLYNASYNSLGKNDRLHHDQGQGDVRDTGYMLDDIPSNIVSERYCACWVAYWFDESVSFSSYTIDNIYYHTWQASSNGECKRIGWNTLRTNPAITGINDYYEFNEEDAKSSIYYNKSLDGVNKTYLLNTHLLNITDETFTDNNIYELYIVLGGNGVYGECRTPGVISNRSFTSFVLFNVPSNESLQENDTDNDNLNDWIELYQTYTSPFLKDTDNDSINDYWEYLSGSDPNNYTETYNVSKPEFSNEYPSNGSIEVYHDSVSTSVNVSLPYFSGENNYTGFNDTDGYSIYYTPLSMLKGQKFRVSDNFTFYNLNLYGYVPYENYTLTCELYLADVDGFPTGNILSIGNTSTSGWGRSSGTADWFSIYMTPYNMTENTDYVIVFNSSETSSTNNFFLARSLANPYANGFAIRYQFGVWNKLASIDYFFTIRGTNGTYVNVSFLSNISGDWKEYGKLYIGENKNCTIYINNLTFENQLYYWIVNASYNYVKENFSEFIYNISGIYYFIMYDNMSQFISIDNGMNGTTVYNATPTFVWSKLVNAAQYWLQVSNDSTFTDLVINISNVNRENYPSECTETTRKVLFTIPSGDELMLYQTYYCRVKAYIKGEV